MRITGIHATKVLPIQKFEIDDLSDVVVIAGANGVGKTRLLEWFIQFLRKLPSDQERWITVEATYGHERKEWGKSILDTRNGEDAEKLRQTLHRDRKRADQKGTVLNFESNRSIAPIKPYAFTWEASDPFYEEIGWDFGLRYLRDRFQDTQHSIFRKVRSRREKIAEDIEALIKNSSSGDGAVASVVEINPSKYPDPMIPFKYAFSQLLAPKQLLDLDLQQQVLKFTIGQSEFPITSLSSGEREVVNIVFDFILRSPSDCVVIFDEPELHLHPELSYKLIQTLRSVGMRNQFIFCTHSADIISSSLENTVVFITPPHDDERNQAVLVEEDDETHQALKLVGQSIGIIALGRRIVLIEGEHSSLDKQTYGAILRNRFPNLVLVPSGGKSTIQSFANIQEKVLSHAVWGVDFFMLCDRDARTPDDFALSSENRLRTLSRYHLENFFLDEFVIAQVFESLEAEDSWLRDPVAINNKLKDIARKFVPYAAALIVSAKFRELVGNIDIMPKGVHEIAPSKLSDLICAKANQEIHRINQDIDSKDIRKAVNDTISDLETSFNDPDDWKKKIPGRQILKKFCGTNVANIDFGRFKMAYVKSAETASSNPFAEIVDIFEHFSSYSIP